MYRIISCHGKIPTYAGNQKQQSADKVTSNRPEKLRFGQRRVLCFIKLFNSISEVRLQVKDYNTGSETFIASGDGRSISHENIFRKGDFQNGTYNFDVINSLRDKAEKFFFKKDITEFQKAVLSALY